MIAAIKSNDEAVNYVLMMMTFRAAGSLADQNARLPVQNVQRAQERGVHGERFSLINSLHDLPFSFDAASSNRRMKKLET